VVCFNVNDVEIKFRIYNFKKKTKEIFIFYTNKLSYSSSPINLNNKA
jgi:hypothetical protein